MLGSLEVFAPSTGMLGSTKASAYYLRSSSLHALADIIAFMAPVVSLICNNVHELDFCLLEGISQRRIHKFCVKRTSCCDHSYVPARHPCHYHHHLAQGYQGLRASIFDVNISTQRLRFLESSCAHLFHHRHGSIIRNNVHALDFCLLWGIFQRQIHRFSIEHLVLRPFPSYRTSTWLHNEPIATHLDVAVLWILLYGYFQRYVIRWLRIKP